MIIDITKWNRISEDAFKGFHYDSGVLVKNFDPTNFTEPDDDDILCVTSGNITVQMTPTIVDLGTDVNGLHGQFKELQMLQQWTSSLGFTSLDLDLAGLKLALGAADIDGNSVKPRMYLKDEDFVSNIALIMFRMDGGLTAAVLNCGMATGGLSLTTSKEGKVTNAMTLTGYSTMSDQSAPAIQFYAAYPNQITLDKHEAEITVGGDTLTLTATAPDGVTINWSSDNTSEATVTSGGVVAAVAAGTVTITASYTDSDSNTYSDSCIVHVKPAQV